MSSKCKHDWRLTGTYSVGSGTVTEQRCELCCKVRRLRTSASGKQYTWKR